MVVLVAEDVLVVDTVVFDVNEIGGSIDIEVVVVVLEVSEIGGSSVCVAEVTVTFDVSEIGGSIDLLVAVVTVTVLYTGDPLTVTWHSSTVSPAKA